MLSHSCCTNGIRSKGLNTIGRVGKRILRYNKTVTNRKAHKNKVQKRERGKVSKETVVLRRWKYYMSLLTDQQEQRGSPFNYYGSQIFPNQIINEEQSSRSISPKLTSSIATAAQNKKQYETLIQERRSAARRWNLKFGKTTRLDSSCLALHCHHHPPPSTHQPRFGACQTKKLCSDTDVALFLEYLKKDPVILVIGLITVFDAILTVRQSGQKLQCLYGNPIANNFFQNWISHNLWIATLKY